RHSLRNALRSFMVVRPAAFAALKQPWQANAGVEPTGAVAAARRRVATAARKTFLTIRLLRLVITQRYATAIGPTTSRAVNLLVPLPRRLAKSGSARTHPHSECPSERHVRLSSAREVSRCHCPGAA